MHTSTRTNRARGAGRCTDSVSSLSLSRENTNESMLAFCFSLVCLGRCSNSDILQETFRTRASDGRATGAAEVFQPARCPRFARIYLDCSQRPSSCSCSCGFRKPTSLRGALLQRRKHRPGVLPVVLPSSRVVADAGKSASRSSILSHLTAESGRSRN